jgi:hypothetical protein
MGSLGICSNEPAGARCAGSGCLGRFQVGGLACDGKGQCNQPQQSIDCQPYSCNLATGMCATKCTSDLDCALLLGYTCNKAPGKCM